MEENKSNSQQNKHKTSGKKSRRNSRSVTIKGYYFLDDMLKAPKMSFLWKFIPRYCVSAIIAPGGVGKSTLVRALIKAILLMKSTFLGWILNVKYGRVIYASTEEGLSAHKKAFQKLMTVEELKSVGKENLVFILETSGLFSTL